MSFNGFYNETIHFFENIRENNNKEWFEKNKYIYEEFVKQPAIDFVIDLGKILQKKISDAIIYDPRINKSIFRLYRDTRFSKNKSPYKTHQGIFIWEGEGKKLENSGFYFHIEPPNIMMGAGLYMIPRNKMAIFRDRVAYGKSGKEIDEVKKKIKKKNYKIGGTYYKRIPRGFEEESLNTDLLLHNGLWAEYSINIPDQFFSKDLIDFCFQKFSEISSIHKWLVKYI